MADEKESIFDRAETLFRRTFEKLGAKVDSKIMSESETIFNPREIGDLITKLERSVDSNLKPDNKGVTRLAPNYFKVLITYERALNLNRMHTEALCKELKATVQEYIQNRRYEIKEPIQMVIARDFFVKTATVRASFDSTSFSVPTNELLAPQNLEEPQSVEVTQRVLLEEEGGRKHKFEIKAGGAPISLGRGAGNQIRIDDQSLSRIHSSFSMHQDGMIVIADLNSSNGTIVNNRLLRSGEAQAINPGDVIQVGDIVLIVKAIS